ncbi:cytochrome oxidase putative small subunit CydP [Legionella sp. W05-934-2]|uniref:cytochrome oxidase putative small subunit CydP n=1 Tax=Legionella sp. W05-934-2 TaxID=1198649 RepID=UPI003461A87C
MLSRDIKITLLIKLLLLFLLWFICFRGPRPTIDLGQHLYSIGTTDDNMLSTKRS